jgi:hypothetical protein
MYENRKDPKNLSNEAFNKAPRSSFSPSPISEAISKDMARATGSAVLKTQLGLGNALRNFDSLDRYTNPSHICVEAYGLANITRSFTNSATLAANADKAAIDTTETNPNANLYPHTAIGETMEKEIFQVYEQIFKAGVGERTTPSFSAFTRYIAMLVRALQIGFTARNYNWLLYHCDWKQFYPYTSFAPPALSKQAAEGGALDHFDDLSLERYWAPLLRRLDTLVLPPRILEYLQWFYNPSKSTGINGRLFVPLACNQDDTQASLRAELENLVNYITIDNRTTTVAMQSFIPFPLLEKDIWKMSPVDMDVLKAAMYWNSGCKLDNFVGIDRTLTYADYLLTDGSTPANYQALTLSPTYDEVANTPIFVYTASTNASWCITRNLMGHRWVHEDDGTVTFFDEVHVDNSEGVFRWTNFLNSRYILSSTSAGTLKGVAHPDYTPVRIGMDEIMRIAKYEALLMFEVPALREVIKMGTGQSLREVRDRIKAATMSRV